MIQFTSSVQRSSHELLSGGKYLWAKRYFHLALFFLWASDVQLLGEARLVRDHCQGNCFAQVARKQPFHLLNSEAARVSMESRSKAGRQLKWQWQRPSRISTDTQTCRKFRRFEGIFFWNPESRCTQSMTVKTHRLFGWKIVNKGI